MKGLILKNQNGYFTIFDEDHVMHLGRSRGRLKKKTDILVGDEVEYEWAGSEPSITKVFPRRNQLVRPPSANIDLLVMTVSAARPEVNTYTLDRMLVLAENAEIPAIICINKSDLAEEASAALAELYRKAGYTVISTSLKTGEGLEALLRHLTGRIIAFSGPSGVGKSSLLNHFLGEDHFEAGEISSKTGRGKNTTRHASLRRFGAKSFLMDTPGYTSLSIETIHKEDAGFLFPDFRPYLGQCRFRNCQHLQEPECAVRQAVESGNISPSRYRSYCQILGELSDLSSY